LNSGVGDFGIEGIKASSKLFSKIINAIRSKCVGIDVAIPLKLSLKETSKSWDSDEGDLKVQSGNNKVNSREDGGSQSEFCQGS
jgi:hypothetical protein